MKSINKKLNTLFKGLYVISVILLMSSVVVIPLCLEANYKPQTPSETVTCGEDVIKTVAHIDVDTERFECIYSDYNDDVAYYIIEPHTLCVSVGDKVFSVENVEYTVTDVDATGFFFEYDPTIHTGLSGTSVLDSDGNVVGYVCEIINGKKVYCIWS